MSFTPVTRKFDRLYRSKLFMPGSRPSVFEKGAASEADVLCMDLEDAVAPPDKLEARKNIVTALNGVEFGDKFVTVRINGLDTHYCYRDVIDLIEQGGERLDAIMVPKVGKAADIYAIDMLITQASEAVGLKKQIGLEIIIESAMGIEHVDELCAASPRLQTVHFGAADYAASTYMRTTNIGGSNAHYTVLTDPDGEGGRAYHWGDMWHYPLMRLVAAARMNGVVPIDGPFGDFSDEAGFRNQAMRTAVMGFEGKWAIHPKQVPLANDVYTPPEEEVTKAREILAAMEKAQSEGAGAVTYKGTLVDRASIRQAEVIVKKMEQIAK